MAAKLYFRQSAYTSCHYRSKSLTSYVWKCGMYDKKKLIGCYCL